MTIKIDNLPAHNPCELVDLLFSYKLSMTKKHFTGRHSNMTVRIVIMQRRLLQVIGNNRIQAAKASTERGERPLIYNEYRA